MNIEPNSQTVQPIQLANTSISSPIAYNAITRKEEGLADQIPEVTLLSTNTNITSRNLKFFIKLMPKKNINKQLLSEVRRANLPEVINLLKAGAHPDFQDEEGFTSLHLAAQNGHTDIIQELIRNKANLNITDKENWRSIDWAVNLKRPAIVLKLLEAGADFKGHSFNNRSMAVTAIRLNWPSILKILLDKGINPDDDLLLHKAINIDNLPLFSMILYAGANPNIIEPRTNSTPLHQATKKDNQKMISALLKAGANGAATNFAEDTALDVAIRKGAYKAFETLSKQNEAPQSKAYPLHLAMIKGDCKIIKALLKIHNVNTLNNEHQTPLLLFCKQKWPESLGELKIIAQEYDKSCLSALKVLLDAGADPNILDKEGFSPLHWAVILYKPQIASMLLKAGADLEAKQKKSKLTPLQLASDYNFISVIKVLLDAGADINIVDDQGRTLLHRLFITSDGLNKLQTAEALLQAGVDFKARDNNFETAHDLVKEKIVNDKIYSLFTSIEGAIELTTLTKTLKVCCIDVIKQHLRKTQGSKIEVAIDTLFIPKNLKTEIKTTKTVYVSDSFRMPLMRYLKME